MSRLKPAEWIVALAIAAAVVLVALQAVGVVNW